MCPQTRPMLGTISRAIKNEFQRRGYWNYEMVARCVRASLPNSSERSIETIANYLRRGKWLALA